MSDQSQSTRNPPVPPTANDPQKPGHGSVTTARLVPVPAAERVASGLSKEEMALAMRAEAWAADAARLAEVVAASVGPPPS